MSWNSLLKYFADACLKIFGDVMSLRDLKPFENISYSTLQTSTEVGK